ncbi:hypothetical protein [Tepidanaerobacter sp. EBM-38]
MVNGVGDNKFAPDVLINREQMVAMLNPIKQDRRNVSCLLC